MWTKSTLGKVRAAAVIVSGIMISCGTAARAAVVTFAQFQESSPVSSNANLFSYINNGNGATGDAELVSNGNGTPGSAIPVNFSYEMGLANLPVDLQGPQAATLTLTASTFTVASTSFMGTVANQPISGKGGVSDTLTITRDAPAAEGNGARTVLLSMSFTGNLMGLLGGTTPQLSGNSAVGDTVNYSSDFLALGTTVTPRDFALTFSSWITAVDGKGLELNSDGYYSASATAASGTFDASSNVGALPVPQPGSLAMGSVLMVGLLTLVVRKQAHRD